MPLNHPNKEMKDRIRQIMESQHMTQQVFAQFIEMSPASLSSIFNGRTKPTLNIVEAIKKKIPDINIDWLMFGTGSMYRDTKGAIDVSQEAPIPSSPTVEDQVLNFDLSTPPTPMSSVTTVKRPLEAPRFNSVKNTHSSAQREDMNYLDKQPRRVTEIRVFYDDQTWESFIPAKK